MNDNKAPSVPPTNVSISQLHAMRSPWYAAILRAYDTVLFATQSGMHEKGISQVPASLTTTSVSSPSGLGSDSLPVRVKYRDSSFFLSDSAQFLLEYSLRINSHSEGCYYILPSFRGDQIDERHLTQFLHCEAEIVGGLADVKALVSDLIVRASTALLDNNEADLQAFGCGTMHLEQAAKGVPIETLDFVAAARLLRGRDGVIVENSAGGRSLTSQGEADLLRVVDAPFVWVENYDAMAVPFYQRLNRRGDTAANADLLFGLGEVVGAGARHPDGAAVRHALQAHGLSVDEYAWYVAMKDEFPLATAGFGIGLERFLAWVFGVFDVRQFEVFARDHALRGAP